MRKPTPRLGVAAIVLALSTPAYAIEGNYRIQGSNAGNQGDYTAEARIKRTGETFSIVMKAGEVGYIGTGIVDGAMLSVVFQPLVENAAAVVASYHIVEDSVVGGSWSILGSDAIGQEKWIADRV